MWVFSVRPCRKQAVAAKPRWRRRQCRCADIPPNPDGHLSLVEAPLPYRDAPLGRGTAARRQSARWDWADAHFSAASVGPAFGRRLKVPNLETRRGAPVTAGGRVSALRLIWVTGSLFFFSGSSNLPYESTPKRNTSATCLALAAERFVTAPAVPTPCHALFPELLTRPIASDAVPGRASAHAFRWALGV